MFSLKIRKKARISPLAISIKHCLTVQTREIRQEKETAFIFQKKKNFINGMISYIEDLKSTKKPIRNKLSNFLGYKNNIHKLILYLYSLVIDNENEIENSIYEGIKKNKYLGIN